MNNEKNKLGKAEEPILLNFYSSQFSNFLFMDWKGN